MRRPVAVLAVVVGVGLAAIPLAYSLFDRAGNAERILDRFEFFALDGQPARYLAEAETTRRGSTELVRDAIPSLASDAGMSKGELDRFAEARLPALTTARVEIPESVAFSNRYSGQLDAVDGKFQSVYDIPVGGLALTAVPWLFLAGGLACVAAGIVALRTTATLGLVAILVLGSAMFLGPLAVGAPGKAAAGEDVKDFASRGLSARAATAAEKASAALDAFVRETTGRTLPELARRKGVAKRELVASLDSRFPAAATLLAEWDGIGPRLSRLAHAVSRSVDEFDSARGMPIAFPVWLLLAAGLAMSLSAGVALMRERVVGSSQRPT